MSGFTGQIEGVPTLFMRRCALLGACALGSAGFGAVARAQQEPPLEPCATGRHVSLAFDPSLDATLQQETTTDLESELGPRGFAVCRGELSASGSAAAEVRVEARGPQRIAIEVFDRTTDKRVGRDLSLVRIPDNGRALAIAIAIDELLRASWAELSLRVAPPLPAAAGPTMVTPTAPPASADVVVLGLGLAATYARSFDHYDSLGAVAVVDALAFRVAWLEARGGFTRALTRKVREGAIEVLGPSTALTLGACLELGAHATRLCLGARTHLELLTFSGDVATSTSQARGQSSFNAVLTEAGVGQLRVRLWRSLALALELGAGSALVGARITDGTRTLSRIDGLLLESSLGLGVTL